MEGPVNQSWQALGSRSAWTTGLAITAFICYAAAAFAFDNLLLDNFAAGWIFINLGTYLECLMLALVALKLLPAVAWETASVGRATNLTLAFVVGAIKNSTVFFASHALGLDTSRWDAVTRVLGGGALGAGIFVLWVSVTASRQAHKALTAQLLESRSQLLKLRSEVGQRYSETQTELIKKTQTTLLPKLTEIQGLLQRGGTDSELLKHIQSITETEVRPLSYQFQEAAEQLAGTPEPRTIAVKDGLTYPARFELRSSIKLVFIFALLIPAQVLALHTIYGPQHWLQLVPTMIPTIVLLALNPLLFPAAKEFRRATGLFLLLLTGTLASLPQFIILWVLSPKLSLSPALGAITAAGISVACFFWLTYVTISNQSLTRFENELADLNKNVQRELAIFDQTLWLQKRAWGYLLHGKVQAALTISLARLRHLEKIGGLTSTESTSRAETLKQVNSDLSDIIGVISNPPESTIDLRSELKQLSDAWVGVVDIVVDITSRAEPILEHNQNLQMAVNEICREAATNAYRHGGASQLSIKCDHTAPGEIELTLINNGRAPENPQPGMGLQMLDALTLEWNLRYRKGSGLTTLTAKLAVAENPS
jgi:two-component sensor histidine kinase